MSKIPMQAVATVDDTNNDVATFADTHPALRTMIQGLATRSMLSENTGGEEFVMDIMEGILSADSFDDIFAAQDAGGISGKDFAGRPFVVASSEDIEWFKSTQGNGDAKGVPAYARMTVTEIATGEEISLACGGNTFVATLWSLESRGYFDKDQYPDGRALVIVEKPSPAGAYLQLKPFKRPEPASARKK